MQALVEATGIPAATLQYYPGRLSHQPPAVARAARPQRLLERQPRRCRRPTWSSRSARTSIFSPPASSTASSAATRSSSITARWRPTSASCFRWRTPWSARRAVSSTGCAQRLRDKRGNGRDVAKLRARLGRRAREDCSTRSVRPMLPTGGRARDARGAAEGRRHDHGRGQRGQAHARLHGHLRAATPSCTSATGARSARACRSRWA